jgi:hypothetical protein
MLSVKRDWGRIQKETNPSGQYRCSKCRDWKLPTEFNKNKYQKSGLNCACRSCMIIEMRKYNLPAKYGISVATYAEMLLAQGGKCECCKVAFVYDGVKSMRPCVDHNHKTNEVRDLICGRCNLAAGNVNDSSLKAEQVSAYLRKWKC